MPNHGKGGRKPIGAEAKRAQLPVRTTNELKAMLVEAAKGSGVSVTVEIERRLTSSLAWGTLDTESMRLFDVMRAELARAEELGGKGKRWHSDLRTFAMAREAIYGTLARRCPPIDSLTNADGEAVEIFAEIRSIDERCAALSFAVRELNCTIPLNKEGFFDLTAPRYDVEGSRCQLLERESHPHREAILEIMNSMDRLDDKRRPLAEEYRSVIAAQIEVINQAASEWRADEAARGIQPVEEYRPDGGLSPLMAPTKDGGPERPTGMFVKHPLDPHIERWHRDFVNARSGAELDDNPD